MKVLLIPAGAVDMPSARLRAYQLVPHLESRGFEVAIWLPDPGARLRWSLPQLSRLAGRLLWADVIWIQKRLFPERFLRLCIGMGKKILYDFDDAVYLNDDGTPNDSLERFEATLRRSHIVIAGNRQLGSLASRSCSRVEIVPTCVSSVASDPRETLPAETVTVIGWVGTKGNLRHLDQIESVLRRLHEVFGDRITLRVVSDGTYEHPDIHVENRPWSLAGEAGEVRGFDIGIMPLEETEYSRSKCAFKALLYMSQGVATVASDLGMNHEVILDGRNGLLARGEAGWFEALSSLANDRQRRAELGRSGLQTVKAEYTVDRAASALADALEQLAR